MSLTLPSIGITAGPDYADELNNNFSSIDQHDHTSGQGVPITPAGLNINSALSFSNNFATAVAGLTLQAQTSVSSNLTVFAISNDMYFKDGAGNNVRITQSGAVAGSPGSIANLVAPASASYGASTFVWQSNTNIAAHMDFGSAVMRNITPNSTYALTLSPPASLAANYALTLPALPASTKIMALTSGGTMSAPYSVDNSTVEISSNTIQVKTGGITTAQIAARTIVAGNIALNTITSDEISLTAGIAGTQLASNTIANVNMINGSIGTTKLASGAVDRTKMASAPFLFTAGSISASGGTIVSGSYVVSNGLSNAVIQITGYVQSGTGGRYTITAASTGGALGGVANCVLDTFAAGFYPFSITTFGGSTSTCTISATIVESGGTGFTASASLLVRDQY